MAKRVDKSANTQTIEVSEVSEIQTEIVIDNKDVSDVKETETEEIITPELEITQEIKSVDTQSKTLDTISVPPRKFKKSDMVFDKSKPKKVYIVSEFYGIHWSSDNLYKLIAQVDDEEYIAFEKNLEII